MRAQHRLQSSIEFLLLLGAVATFCVFAIAVYTQFSGVQEGIYNGISNITGNLMARAPVSSSANGLSIFLALPNSTAANSSTSLYLIVNAPGQSVTVNSTIAGYDGLSISPTQLSSVVNGFGILVFSAVPESQGLKRILDHVVATGNNVLLVENLTGRLIAYPSKGGMTGGPNLSSQSLTGSIRGSGERINYPLAQPSALYNFWYASHCAYHGWYSGGVLPEPAQCGGNTWGFDTPDNRCNPYTWDGEDRYYCFGAQPLKLNVSVIGQQKSYAYNVIVGIQNSSLSLRANLSSSKNYSQLVSSAGVVYGYARLLEAYGSDAYPVPYSAYVALQNGTYHLVNMSGYTRYSASYANLVGQLDAYNNSYSSNPGGMAQLVNIFNGQESAFAGSGYANSSACNFVGTEYLSCNASQPLSFVVELHLNGSKYSDLNQTLYLGSSIVEIT